MSRRNKVIITLLFIFFVLQLIRPASNTSNQVEQADILQHFNVPSNIAGILKTACYDCHSNHTRYPWYANIQPIGWLLAKHIRDGKAELNFNEFVTYSNRRQFSKLKAIYNSIKDGTMPLTSYTLLHQEAKLSKESKALLMDWALNTADSLSQKTEIKDEHH
jgi:hypothetical protein